MSVLVCFSFAGCKEKDNVEVLSKNLTEYNIDLVFDDTDYSMTAHQTVSYYNNTGSILKNVQFHLYPQFFEEGNENLVVSSTKYNQAYPNGLSFANFNVDRVVVDNLEQNVEYFGEQQSILNVKLNSSLMPKERVKIKIDFNFSLGNCLHRFGYGENTINICNFYPIACVYENGGFNTLGYNSNGDPFYSEMANYIVSLQLDKNFVVATSGTKTDEIQNEKTKTLKFKANLIRDFAIVLSKDFKVISKTINDTCVDYFYFNDTNADKSLQAGVDALDVFSKKFGDYPYKNFSIVQADFVYGGMEYPALIMVSEISNLDDYLNVIIHETAHQWWYGMVGNDEYTYPWLDEALTEYSTILFYDLVDGYNLNHKDMVKSYKENYSLFYTVYTDVLGTLDTSMRAVDKYSTEPEYTYCIYVKGVLMYESLYSLVGENSFYKSLKNYFEKNKYKNATPNDLIDSFSNTCKKDLTNFFDSWINGKVVIR